jgi:hypothetical protein
MTTDWAKEYLAAAKVYDFSQDPDDFRVTRQSKVTIGGLLVPVSEDDRQRLDRLNLHYRVLFRYFRARAQFTSSRGVPALASGLSLTATMQAMLQRSASRAEEEPDFSYISIDPRDYTIFTSPHVPVPVVCIHTRPERCWFLGVLRFEGALGLSLGRMRVMRPNENGMYPVTIRTKWRALTNKVKQEEVRDAYRRLIDPTV